MPWQLPAPPWTPSPLPPARSPSGDPCGPSCAPQDDEINQQSQIMEKLKQQMLDQEEVRALPPTL